MCRWVATAVAFAAGTFCLAVGIVFNNEVCINGKHENATLPQWLIVSSLLLYAMGIVRAEILCITNCCGRIGTHAYRVTSMICGTAVMVSASVGAALLIISDDACKELDLATLGGTGYSIANDTTHWLLDEEMASRINDVGTFNFLWVTALLSMLIQFGLG